MSGGNEAGSLSERIVRGIAVVFSPSLSMGGSFKATMSRGVVALPTGHVDAG